MGWVGGANAKKGERKGKMGGWGGGDKIVDKQCTSCNVVNGYSRV